MSGIALPGDANGDQWIRQPIDPVRLVWQTAGLAALLDGALLLAGGGGATTGEPVEVCTLRHNGSRPGLLLDFGRELHGGVEIRVGDASIDRPARLLVRFGESVTEAMTDALGQEVCTVEPARTYELGHTGFRFVRLDLLDEDTFVRLDRVRAILVCRRLERKGTFRCSDDRLTRLWQVGADTVHLCLQEHLWDGIKRDRQVWVGDMHPAVTVVNAVFGELAIVRESLDLVRDETPLPGWMNGIAAYSLWWVLIHRDWYLQHGDWPYLDQQRVYLWDLLGLLIARIDGDGREDLDGWRFLDWSICGDDPALHAGLQALLHWGLEAGAQLCAVLGETGCAAGCRAAMSRLRRDIPADTMSKPAHALRVLAGLADPGETNQRVLGHDPLRGLSPYLGYDVLQARARAGDIGGCLDLLRRYWGVMLDLGATTFWEDFDPAWAEDAVGIDRLVPAGRRDVHADGGRHFHQGLAQSLCHGWSSGPTAWLSGWVLGIEPVEPGCRVVRVVPHLGDLRWAEGSYPMPRGPLRVRHERGPSGSIKSDIQAPVGVRVVT